MILGILLRTNKHFQHAQGAQFASALSYSTLLSVVPITLLLFFISMQTDFFSSMFESLREQLLVQLLPTSRGQVETYLMQTTRNIKSFSVLSMIIIFFSAVWLSIGVERALNHLWQVKTPRKLALRIPGHIILWLFAPLLIMLSITLSTWFSSLPYLSSFSHHVSNLSHLLPWLISSTALFLLYYFVPNTRVRFKNASLAAAIAGLLFEVSKWLFTIYITEFAIYEKLYGALATLPIFMLWVFISWVIVLWGASLSITLQALPKPNNDSSKYLS